MHIHSNIERVRQEVRRIVREAETETDPRDKAVCPRELYARAFAIPAGALLVKGITPAEYQSIYTETQQAFIEWQSDK